MFQYDMREEILIGKSHYLLWRMTKKSFNIFFIHLDAGEIKYKTESVEI